MSLVKKSSEKHSHHSAYIKAKGFRQYKIAVRTFIRDVILICLGIGSAAFGLESFLLPNNFIDGGATGVSLMVSEITKLPLAVLLVLINIPFVWLGLKTVGKQGQII